ncbi:hypothetical protein [Rhizobium binxianense]
MYEMLNEVHRGFAILAVILTLCWAGMVLMAQKIRTIELGRVQRLVYVGATAFTGLVGVTGLAAMVIGQWLAMVFPWVGLLAVVGHGVAGSHSRKALAAGNKRAALTGAFVQFALLIFTYGLMTVKPF